MEKINLPDLKIHQIEGNNDYLIGNEITYPYGVRKETPFLITPEMITKDLEENVAGLADKVYTSVFSKVDYVASDKNIYFYAASGDLLFTIDATDFIRDGMLDSVTYDKDNATLQFVFNTDAGKEQIDVNISTLIDIYTGGDGITIENNVVAIHLDEENESAYLTVSEKGLKLSGVVNINSRLEDAEEYIDDCESGNNSITNDDIDALFTES